MLAPFTVHVPRVISMSPASAPIGTLLRINGEHFGFYSESGATPYNFMDFNTGENRVEIGGVPAVIYRWNDDRIDVGYRSARKPARSLFIGVPTRRTSAGSVVPSRVPSPSRPGTSRS